MLKQVFNILKSILFFPFNLVKESINSIRKIKKVTHSLHELLFPFIACFYNSFFPGAGYWFIGKWGDGFLHSFVFFIFFGLFLLLTYIVSNMNNVELSILGTYIPLCVLSGCIVFPAILKSREQTNPNIQKAHSVFQLIFAPVINVPIPGSGFWLIGDFKGGIINQIIYISSTFTFVGLIKRSSLNLEMEAVFIYGFIFTFIIQVLAGGLIICETLDRQKNTQEEKT